MLDLIDHGKAEEEHPAIWAPFVIVGEGGPEDEGAAAHQLMSAASAGGTPFLSADRESSLCR